MKTTLTLLAVPPLVLLAAAALLACGHAPPPAPEAAATGAMLPRGCAPTTRLCADAERQTPLVRGCAIPGRTLAVPEECCLSPTALGGEIRCPGNTALSWAVVTQPQRAPELLDEYVAAFRNSEFGQVTERQVQCSLQGVPTTCWLFSAVLRPGPPQPLHAIVGAVTKDGQGLLAACQYFGGAGRPGVCRQIFTP